MFYVLSAVKWVVTCRSQQDGLHKKFKYQDRQTNECECLRVRGVKVKHNERAELYSDIYRVRVNIPLLSSPPFSSPWVTLPCHQEWPNLPVFVCASGQERVYISIFALIALLYYILILLKEILTFFSLHSILSGMSFSS